MDLIIETIFETEWGVILLGALLLIGLAIELFGKNKPKF